jgi:hypothetical protein
MPDAIPVAAIPSTEPATPAGRLARSSRRVLEAARVFAEAVQATPDLLEALVSTESPLRGVVLPLLDAVDEYEGHVAAGG